MSFLVLCLLAVVPFGYTLFEDQIGIFDWNQKFIGSVDFVDQSLLTDHGTYLFGSKNNVLSSVHVKNGSIFWRQVFEDTGTLTDLIVCDQTVLSLSRTSNIISRAWNARSGSIIWEKTHDFLNISSCQCFLPSALLCSSETGLFIFSLHTGRLLWSAYNLTSSSTQTIEMVPIFPNSTHQGVVILSSGGTTLSHETEIRVITVLTPMDDPRHAIVHNTGILSIKNLAEGTKSCLIVHDSSDIKLFLVCSCFNPFNNGGLLKVLSLSEPQSEWLTTAIEQRSPQIQRLKRDRILVFTSASGSGAVFEINSGVLVHKYSIENVMFVSLTSSHERDYLFVGFHDAEQSFKNFRLTVYDSVTGALVDGLPTLQWTIAKHHGAVVSIYASVFTDTQRSLNFRLLIKTEDQAIQLFHKNGHLQWVRDEALADIVAVEMVDLPVSESQARMEEEFGHTHNSLLEMFFRRFRTQASQLLAFLECGLHRMVRLFRDVLLTSHNSAKQHSELRESTTNGLSEVFVSVPPRLKTSLPAAVYETEDSASPTGPSQTHPLHTGLHDFLTRDTFNLHKMIVVATAVGKIFGLESEKGRVVWEHLVPAARVLANGKLVLFQQRNTAHFPLPPITTLLLRSAHTNLPMLFSFNPITGIPLYSSTDEVIHWQSDIIQAVLLPGPATEETDYIRPILLLDMHSQVHVHPPEYSTCLSPDAPPLYLYTIEHTLARLTGYRVHVAPAPENNVTTKSTVVHTASRVWRMHLRSFMNGTSSAAESHMIVASASRPPTEHVHSVGRVLGDRSVLYKYLNPNLIAVVTAGGEVATQTNAIMLYLVDVVTGVIVYSTTHRRCSEPVNLVHSENWIVYSYYNHKSLRHEVTVLELFESTVNGESCGAFSVPGPIQLFFRNAFPTHWLRSFHTSSSTASTIRPSSQTTLWSSGLSRSVFSSLYRATRFGGVCYAAGTSSLVPHVLQQSYIFTTPPSHGVAAVSLTERGITSKSIIFGLQKGALIELPKTLFDPRRAIDLSPELAEEGVHPYTPVLPLSDHAVISYNQSVMGIRAVRTAMTGLESTSLVFAYGLDLFFTRIAPSLMYDLLKEDFDYTAIATVTLGMIVASVVTQRLAARRAMFRAWS